MHFHLGFIECVDDDIFNRNAANSLLTAPSLQSFEFLSKYTYNKYYNLIDEHAHILCATVY